MADPYSPPESDWIAPARSRSHSRPSSRAPSPAPSPSAAQPDTAPLAQHPPPDSAAAVAPRLYFPSAPSRTPSAASNQSSNSPLLESGLPPASAYPARGASLGAAAVTAAHESIAGARHSTAAPPPSLPPRPAHEHSRGPGTGQDSDLSLLDAVNSLSPSLASPSSPPPPPSADRYAMPAPIPIPARSPSDSALSPDEARYGALPLSNTDSSAYSLDVGSPPPATSAAHIGLGFAANANSRLAVRPGEHDASSGASHDLPQPPSLPPRHRQNSLGSAEAISAPEPPPRQPSLPADLNRNGTRGDTVVPVGFDEGALRALCDMDCGTPLLLDRMKQSMASCREASNFFKKRAQIEEEYARSLTKLAKSSAESYSAGDGKAGSYVSSWLTFLRTHELVGEARLKFAAQLSEMSDELTMLGKEVDKNRKAAKELASKLEKGLQEQDALVDRARMRFDAAAEDLERLLVLKQGETVTPSSVPHAGSSTAAGGVASKGRSFGKAMSKLKGPKNAAQYAKQEEEVRSRMGQTSDSYRAQVSGAQSVRQEYFQTQLPRVLRTLKENVDELDLGTQYHLSRYAYLLENVLVTEGLTIAPVAPEDGQGLRTVIESIDLREDFKTYMQQYSLNWQMSGQQRGPKREGPEEESFPYDSPSQSAAAALPTFGVDLGEQMLRDGVEVPRVLEKCAEAIELYGLESKGIYRLSGTTSRVQRLKAALDHDVEAVDLLSEENLSDINDIAAVLKLWFRELPEPLLTWELYHAFVDAAKIENDRLRHIRLHERINELPDPNYATLKFLMGHLDKVAQYEAVNQMSRSNLAIVFGPNLLGAPPPQLAHLYPGPAPVTSPDGTPASSSGGGGGGLQDMQWQCKCIETILQHFVEIFVE
ncbi:hypothetical protein JCM3774_002549 [Rhodotorula dairenensis]